MKVQLLPPGLTEQINTPEEPAAADWSLRLALNQKLAGSIPASGAVAVLYWFRNLAVNQVYVGSIPIGHPLTGFRLQVSDFSFF